MQKFMTDKPLDELLHFDVSIVQALELRQDLTNSTNDRSLYNLATLNVYRPNIVLCLPPAAIASPIGSNVILQPEELSSCFLTLGP
jgi:hypothetical protein